MKKLYLGCLFTLFSAAFTFAQQEKISFEVYFEFNKAKLKQVSMDKIDSVLTATTSRRLKSRVSGHTCDIGTDNYNMDLSEKRAQATFEFLKEKGEREDRLELVFYGEKDAKYPNDLDGRPLNRRVELTFTLEDDDRDTVIRESCAEVFIEKRSYKPNKNKAVSFELRVLNSLSKLQAENVSAEDKSGKKLYFTGVMYYNAKVNGAVMLPVKNLKIKIPAAGEPKAGFTLYRGEESGGKIVWVNTGKACEPQTSGNSCNTYNFEMSLEGYCACAKQRDCEEDCNPNPFSEETYPKSSEADVKASKAGTMVRFPDGSYPKDLASLQVDVIDDINFEADLDVCEQFTYGVTTKEWYPAYYNMEAIQNIIVETKDGGTAVESDPNKSQKVYVPLDKVKDIDNPVLIYGSPHSKGYLRWDNAKYEQKTCLGSVNCQYAVFEVPGTGGYKLGSWKDGEPQKAADKYILKVRVLKNNVVLVGDKKSNYVYKAKNFERKGKQRPKEYSIHEFQNGSGQMVVLVKHTKKNGEKLYQEAAFDDLIFKSSKNMYIMRRKGFKKVDNFENIEVSKCK